jgi:hypothetical protein
VGSNGLAYYAEASVMKGKSFIASTQKRFHKIVKKMSFYLIDFVSYLNQLFRHQN